VRKRLVWPPRLHENHGQISRRTGAATKRELRLAQHDCCYLCGEELGPTHHGAPIPKKSAISGKTRRRMNRARFARHVTGDHVYPRSSKNGTERNKLLAHVECNVRKADRMPHPCELLYLEAAYLLIDKWRETYVPGSYMPAPQTKLHAELVRAGLAAE
jgi:hypothetical protein